MEHILALITFTLFMSILWFTWLQVSFHDLRYGRDSFYERVCKVFQVASMVVFAARSRAWDPFEIDKPTSIASIKYVTMTLMATRLFLTLQYCVVAYFRKSTNDKKDAPSEPLLPVISHVVVMAVMTVIYLVVSYVTVPEPNNLVKKWRIISLDVSGL